MLSGPSSHSFSLILFPSFPFRPSPLLPLFPSLPPPLSPLFDFPENSDLGTSMIWVLFSVLLNDTEFFRCCRLGAFSPHLLYEIYMNLCTQFSPISKVFTQISSTFNLFRSIFCQLQSVSISSTRSKTQELIDNQIAGYGATPRQVREAPTGLISTSIGGNGT